MINNNNKNSMFYCMDLILDGRCQYKYKQIRSTYVHNLRATLPSFRISRGVNSVLYSFRLVKAFNSIGKPWQSQPGTNSTRWPLMALLRIVISFKICNKELLSFSHQIRRFGVKFYSKKGNCVVENLVHGVSHVKSPIRVWRAIVQYKIRPL